MSRVPFLFVLSILLPFSPNTASGELIHGTAKLFLGWDCDCDQSIDFSAQSLVFCHTPEADFAYYCDSKNPQQIEFGGYPGELMLTVDDIPFEDIDLAPLSGNLYQAVRLNRTYIMRTRDPLWAKVGVISINAGGTVDVQYVVQTDGTRVLGIPLAVEPTTWGRIKALYR